MAVSRGQRLRKKAAKAVKRKAVVAQKLAETRRELSISKPRHVDLAASPLADCLLTSDIAQTGKGALTVSRKLSLGRYAVASFLIDLYCLGVEDAFFSVEEGEDYDDMREEMGETVSAIEPGRARLLLRDAVAYGEANGFEPPPGYGDLARLLSDYEPAGEPFVFGDNGRPHYVVSPDSHDDDVDYAVAVLTDKLGPDGFDITYPLEEDGPEEG